MVGEWNHFEAFGDVPSRATEVGVHEPPIRARKGAHVRTAWAALGRACHHHPYELAPTAPEFEDWLHAVDELISRLGAAETVT